MKTDLGAALAAGGAGDVNPGEYDLVVLAMQEPQYRSPGVRELLDGVHRLPERLLLGAVNRSLEQEVRGGREQAQRARLDLRAKPGRQLGPAEAGVALVLDDPEALLLDVEVGLGPGQVQPLQRLQQDRGDRPVPVPLPVGGDDVPRGVRPGAPSVEELVGQLRDRSSRLLERYDGPEARADHERLPALKSSLAPNGALWIIRPKGVKHITESDTMAAGKAAGLVDVARPAQ